MFSLISGFVRYMFAKTELQIVILGLDNAGKTTTLEQLKLLHTKNKGVPLDQIPPTVGMNIGRMDIDNCQITFWDLGGQISFRGIWDRYYNESQGAATLASATHFCLL